MDDALQIDVITVFPEMFKGFLHESMLARAAAMGKVRFRTVDLRDFSHDQRRTVDDRPYGGGPGMLMKPDVWFEAVEAIRTPAARVILMTPTGKSYRQADAERFAKEKHLIFLCGHYEGIDGRVCRLVTDEISMGDFVVTGGEIPAAAAIDSIVRLLPGVLGGGAEATKRESFGEDGMLEAPQFTRPPEFRGMSVPTVLSGGDHAKAAAWRKRQAVDLTARRRPDLLEVGGTFAAGDEDLVKKE